MDHDQFIRIESGSAQASSSAAARDAPASSRTSATTGRVIIPSGTWHNVVNTGDEPLKLYSLYSPPEHPDGTVHRTKADAEAAER